MSLGAGTRLGAYEIVSLVGAGGMGEVYRARDIRLDRTVAIKVLPQDLAADSDLQARFEREGRAISALDHPNICGLYDVGEHDGRMFLVMQFLDGETLEARLHKGALPPDQALQIAIEIADALDKAHRAGIVHRDLKPANVMLTKSGAKLLDFGLSKRASPVVTTSNLSMLPTTPPNLTAQGTILGTFQYMAPEQIEGLEADPRTDIFAFGALLFEMLTGRRAFEGRTRASLIGAILKDQPPPVSAVQPVSPPALDRIISTCLEKDPDDRYQSARDLLRDLKWAASGSAGAVTPSRSARSFHSRLAWSVAAMSSLALAIVTALYLRGDAPSSDVIQFTIAPPDNASFRTPPGGGTGTATQAAVAPDGRSVVFVANSQGNFQLWLRRLDSDAVRLIPGTEGGAFPFWSPDSRYIGFFSSGKLKKVQVTGGPPVVLCDAVAGRGGTWNRDDVIVFAPTPISALQRVSATGGVPQDVSVLDKAFGETSHRFPFFLPDGRHFIFSGVTGTCCPASKPARIRIGALDSMDAPPLLQAESSAAFASGHLLFNRDGTLMAQPFDAISRRFAGDAFPIAERIGSEGSRYASFSVSDGGVLVYASSLARPMMRLTWMDRSGRELGTVGDLAPYETMALSPDERRVAVVLTTGTPENRDIWILDIGRGTQTRFTFDAGNDNNPVWSPDGLRIAFGGNREGAAALLLKNEDGTTQEEKLLQPGGFVSPNDWSSDGRYLAYSHSQGTGNSTDILALPLLGDRKPIALVQTPFIDAGGVFSPDARWFAYQSAESGVIQIYVQPFPPTGGRFQVSKDGGAHAVWRRDGKELFFVAPDDKLMVAAIDTTNQFQAGIPTPLFGIFTTANSGNVATRQYAATKDGGRFLVNMIQQQSRAIPLTVVVNWPATVQK